MIRGGPVSTGDDSPHTGAPRADAWAGGTFTVSAASRLPSGCLCGPLLSPVSPAPSARRAWWLKAPLVSTRAHGLWATGVVGSC